MHMHVPLVLIESNQLIDEKEMEWYGKYKLQLQPVRYINNLIQHEYRYRDDDAWITSYDAQLLHEWMICRRLRHHLVWCGEVLQWDPCRCTVLYHVSLSSSSVSVDELDEILSDALAEERATRLREQHERERRQQQQQQWPGML